MKLFLLRFWRADAGATAIEYSIMAAGIALAIVASVTAVGSSVTGMYSSILAAFK
jgi:pilus assembly protein Flp/PilA